MRYFSILVEIYWNNFLHNLKRTTYLFKAVGARRILNIFMHLLEWIRYELLCTFTWCDEYLRLFPVWRHCPRVCQRTRPPYSLTYIFKLCIYQTICPIHTWPVQLRQLIVDSIDFGTSKRSHNTSWLTFRLWTLLTKFWPSVNRAEEGIVSH